MEIFGIAVGENSGFVFGGSANVLLQSLMDVIVQG
jgi:hypothetical protein